MLGYFPGFRSDVFDQLEWMRRQLGDLFGEPAGAEPGIRSVAAGTFPAINVGASPEQVDVYVFASGVDKDGLDISLQQNLLSVAGERRAEDPEGAQYYRRERFNGSFRRMITLPEDIDPDKVTASYDNGVLHIAVQRREAVRPRQIEVG
jgi:HSP20 family protein